MAIQKQSWLQPFPLPIIIMTKLLARYVMPRVPRILSTSLRSMKTLKMLCWNSTLKKSLGWKPCWKDKTFHKFLMTCLTQPIQKWCNRTWCNRSRCNRWWWTSFNNQHKILLFRFNMCSYLPWAATCTILNKRNKISRISWNWKMKNLNKSARSEKDLKNRSNIWKAIWWKEDSIKLWIKNSKKIYNPSVKSSN